MSAKPSPFDAATEAALAKLREKPANGHGDLGRFEQRAPASNLAGEAAADLARAISDAPPVGIPASEVHRIGAEAAAAVREKLDRAEKGHGDIEQSSQPDSGTLRGREGSRAHSEAADPAANEKAGEGDPPEQVEEEVAAPRKRKHEPVKAVGVGLMPHRMAAKDSSISRHASPKAEPGATIMTLADDHPAIVEGRTLFPESVHNTWESPRFLVSGKNNPKLGGEFRKGPWTGFPLYQLSLEERATCPRSCLQWKTCYGAGMPFARRNDHRDPDFLYALKAEVVTMARAHPGGFVIRLHTLGDFYSVEYVQVWADLLDALPNLRIFGYTARRENADDDESRRIAKAIRWLTEQAWDLFAIRFSGHDGPQGSIVVNEPDARDHVVMCPAQVYATHACVTCGLCSSPEAKDKAIGFLLHGRKVKSRAETNREKRIAKAAAITEAKASPSNPSQGNDGDPDGAPAFRPPEPAPVKYPSVREPQEEKGSAADVVASARLRISVAGQRT